MPDRIVVNTGPLIALARADALVVASRLDLEFVCPPQVRGELQAGELAGKPAVFGEWLHVLPLDQPLDAMLAAIVDDGEAAVIQLARQHGIRRVCIDDLKARRIAVAGGLEVVGTLGLLLRAKERKLISEVRPFVDRLLAAGAWFDQVLVRRVLDAAGER